MWLGSYTSDKNISFGGQLHEEALVEVRTNDNIDTELLQLISLLCTTDEGSDLKGISLGVIQERRKGRAANVAWQRRVKGGYNGLQGL